MKRAFTLIELLVVIAIIAILAAILFPVFAQAKLAAKKTVALNSTKEIALATYMYVNDYDDVTPSVFILNNGTSVDVYQTLQPYIKNMDIFFSSEWSQTNGSGVGGGTASCNNLNTPPGYYVPTGANATRCVAFGYNWGFGVWAGGALLGFEQAIADGSGAFTPGIPLSGVDSPSQLAAYGDSYNGRRYTMCAIGSDLEYYTGSHNNSSLRYGGSFNFGFADGHAKATKVQGYSFPTASSIPGDGSIMMPADHSTWNSFWCSSASANVRPSNLPGLTGFPDTPCGTFITEVMSGAILPITQWPN